MIQQLAKKLLDVGVEGGDERRNLDVKFQDDLFKLNHGNKV